MRSKAYLASAGAMKSCLGIMLPEERHIRLMDKILHYFKYPKLWELWYIPYYGSCRILSINRTTHLEYKRHKAEMKP